MDVALASCLELPEPDHDEEILLQALKAMGIEVAVLPWDDPRVDWSAVRLTILRSTWNYQQHRESFLAWAAATARVSELWKRYLLDLEASGISITPTEVIPQGADIALEFIRSDRGWRDVVVKPAVSASSFRTLRVRREDGRLGENHLRELAADGDVLVQSYLPSVEDYGERALVWIDGDLTHAVRKRPRFSGDHESVSEAVEISRAEARVAERTIGCTRDLLTESLLYARIDLAPGPNGDLVVMELELIEPSLYFKQSSSALERFVAAISAKLNR
jgi:hypothetical protein